MPLEELNDGHSSSEDENHDFLKAKIFAHILLQNPTLEWKVMNSQPVEEINQRIQIVCHIVNQHLDDILRTHDEIEALSYTLEAQLFIRDSKTVRQKDYGEDTTNQRRLIRLRQDVVTNAISRLNDDERLAFANELTEEMHEEYVTGLEERGDYELTPHLNLCIADMHDTIMNAAFTPIHTGKGAFRIVQHYLQNFIYSVLIACKKQGKQLHAHIAHYTRPSGEDPK